MKDTMSNPAADTYLSQGDLDSARATLVAAVKQNPSDTQARMFLFQLMAVMGEWDKADAQLRALASVTPEAQMLAAAYSPLLQAAKMRAAAFSGEGSVPLLFPGPAWLSDLAASIDAFAKGDVAQGESLRDQAFDQVGDLAGRWNDKAFQWICDVDSRFGPAFEAVIAGRWGLIAFEAVREIKSEGPLDLKDSVWLPVEMTLKSGEAFSGFLLVLYPLSERAASPLRLGRQTQWQENGSGLGQKVYGFDTGEEVDLLSLRHLVMD